MAIADKRRFSTIDNQLNRVAELTGDGRIDGWEIQPVTFPDIVVTKGSGLINKYYVNTFDDQTFELSANGRFFVYAQRRVGVIGTVGPKSDVATIGYTDAGPPATPTGLSVTSPDPFLVVLSWTKNAEDDLDHYDVERESPSGTSLIGTAGVDDSSFQDTTAEEDTTYTYFLYAVDQSDNRSSPASGVITTDLSTDPPPNPLDVTMPTSEAAINILWKRPPSIAFSKVKNWKITYVELNTDNSERTGTKVDKAINKELFNERIDGLTVGQKYKFTLQTVDTKDRISTGVVKNVVPQPTPAPRDPEGIAFTMSDAPGGVEVELSWTDGDTPYDPAVSYRYKIYVTVDGQAESLGIDVPIGQTIEQISLYTFNLVEYFPIPEDKLVTFRITALDTLGFESFGSYIRLETAIFTIPLRLRNLSSEFDQDNRTILITWDNQPDTDDIRIEILKDDLNDEYVGDSVIFENLIGKVERYVLQNALLDHKYTFRLTPLNKDGVEGPTSFTVELTLIQGGLPLAEPPTNLDEKSNDRQIRLTWDQSPTFYADTYNLYRHVGSISLQEEDWTKIDSMNATILTFTDYGLDNDQIYSYYFTTVDIYGRESLHLPDGAVNLSFIEATPKQEGALTEPTNVQLGLIDNNKVLITWESLLEEFDAFTVYRSTNNLHSFESIVTVDRNTFSFVDIELPLVDGTVFYYIVDKVINDADIIIQSSDTQPENSIFLGKISTSLSAVDGIDVSKRRDIKDLIDPLAEYTSRFLLPHKHRGILPFDPDRVDLNPELIVTDWTTVDGRIFFTEEEDINGSSHIVKIDGRFPRVFFTIDTATRRLIFSEPIVNIDPITGEIRGDVPEIEVRVLGVEEVQGILDSFRFDNIHARQIQFGTLNKEQLPSINHEGRIREDLLPKRYLLERFNNHSFIVPQDNVNTTKTFGDGTTFFSIIEADGQIEQVFDFDLFNDGARVGFQRPSFSTTTLENLKQNDLLSQISAGNDISTEYKFDAASHLWFCTAAKTRLKVVNTTTLVPHSIGANEHAYRSLTFDSKNNVLYGLHFPGASFTEIDRIDVATGDSPSTLVLDVSAYASIFETPESIAYNHTNNTLYMTTFETSTNVNRFYSVDLSTGDITLIGTTMEQHGATEDQIYKITHDQDNDIMYCYGDSTTDGRLLFVNVADGTVEIANPSASVAQAHITDIAYDHRDNTLYGLRDGGSFTNELVKIGKDTGAVDTLIGTIQATPAIQAITAPPKDISLYVTGASSVPGNDRVRMGKWPGAITPSLSTDSYLRYKVDIPSGSTVSNCKLQFTADDQLQSSGDNLRLNISILDPLGFADAVDVQFETIRAVGVIGMVVWNPLEWTAGEKSDNTAIDVTTLVQLFVNSSEYTPGRHIIFKITPADTSTIGHYRSAKGFGSPPPDLDMNFVLDIAEVDSVTGGFQTEKSYHLQFEFDDDEPIRWVRVTTEDTANKPNPIINLEKRLRFRILLKSGSIYVSFGIREISIADPIIAADGGTVGPIEWVNVNEVVTDSEGNTAPRGTLIKASNDWQEIDIDLRKAAVVDFENGNAVLAKGFGVLEHIAFTINPDDAIPAGPFDIYIDEIEQISDLLVAGTSQGILLSTDFGISWELSRLTDTPVHKFYRAKNNPFLWAITADEVLLAVDPAFWFVTQGTTGIQNIRDIVDDVDGDMFISTDKGVYKLEIGIIRTFAVFKQTQPISAFTTDCYALYHSGVSSGIDEIWVSTEIGIFTTNNKGQSWVDSGMDTAGLPAFDLFNIGSNTSPNIIGHTRKHILRRLGNASTFEVIANFEEQLNIFDLWEVAYFDTRLFVSTGKGVYMNSTDDFFALSPVDMPFERVFDGLDVNGFTGIAFSLNVVDLGDLGQRLFIGQENRLMCSNQENQLAMKIEFRNKELPSFFINDEQVDIGFTYSAFNNVVSFREPRQVTEIISSAFLPRRIFIAKNKGWAQTNPDAEVFIYKDGIPTWLDWKLDEASILAQLQIVETNLSGVPTLDTFNSLVPKSQEFFDKSLQDILTLREGGEVPEGSEEETTTLINDSTIIQFLDDYTRFLSLVTDALKKSNSLALPDIKLTGIRREDRPPGSRAATLEVLEDFEAQNSVAITIDTVDGEVDFLTAFANKTDPVERARLTFSKFVKMQITIFNTQISGTGEFPHREIEDKMEEVNSGLSSHMSRIVYANLIKSGVFLESQNPFMFDRFNVSNIQSKFYAAHTNDWYDIVNSTVDYLTLIKVPNIPEPRFSTDIITFTEDAYFSDKIWVGTDSDIVQYAIDINGALVQEKVLRPTGGTEPVVVWDIFKFREDEVYVVVAERDTNKGRIFVTINFGTTWKEIDTVNLPNEFFSFSIINGNKVVGTEEGVFYSDNDFGAWFPADVVPSNRQGESSPALTAFRQRVRQFETSTFLVTEQDRWFFTSGGGIEWFSVGRLTNNSATVVNKIMRFKNLTWIGTDRGLYNDGNSLLSDGVAFGLETEIEHDVARSVIIQVNDLDNGGDAVYVASGGGKVYRFLDEDPATSTGNEWKRYSVPDFGPIHKMKYHKIDDKEYLILVSYNKIKTIDVTVESGVFSAS